MIAPSRRVLIECSTYLMNNIGDKAMLFSLGRELRERFPSIAMHVVTSDPDGVRDVLPDAIPSVVPPRVRWSAFRGLSAIDHQAPERQAGVDYALRRAAPDRASEHFVATRADAHTMSWSDLRAAIHASDFVVAMGGGYFSDAFAYHAHGIFETLDEALRAGKPAFMMGTGFEPIATPFLRDAARAVLPRLSLIGCREREVSRQVLAEFGVADDRIVFVGDDAVTLAFDRRAPALGHELGFSVRLAAYAGVSETDTARLGQAVTSIARELGVAVRPLPISVYGPSDAAAIQSALAAGGIVSDGGAALSTPFQLATELHQCRIVVTGSYHAAIFAAAQGIPVVMVAASLHYESKMLGIANEAMRGAADTPGAVVLRSDDPRLAERLREAVMAAWPSAEAARNGRLHATSGLIADRARSYDRLADLVARGVAPSASADWPPPLDAASVFALGDGAADLAQRVRFFEFHATERLRQIKELTARIAALTPPPAEAPVTAEGDDG